MQGTPVVAGVSDHSGWAWLVVVSLKGDRLELVDRQKVTTLDPELPRMPHHHEAADIDIAAAEALVARVRESALARTTAALAKIKAELEPDFRLVSIARRSDPARPIPETVAEILQSHPAMHAADGVLYRHAFDQAARSLGIGCNVVQRNQEMAKAAFSMGLDEASYEVLLKEIGSQAGPPWQKEHRHAFSSAVHVLLNLPARRERKHGPDE